MRNKTMRRGLAWILSAATIMTSVPVSAEEIVLDTNVVSEDEATAEEQSVDADLEEDVVEDDADIESQVTDDEEEAIVIDGTDEGSESSAQTIEDGQTTATVETEDPYSYVYTGQEITPVLAEGETVVDGTASAVNVGEYIVELMDAEGVTREQVWSITPAELTATCYYAEVKADEEENADAETESSEENANIEVAVEVTGFVEGEDETNAAGYVAPHYTQPATLEDAATMKAFGGEADNYTFVYADSVNVGEAAVDQIATQAADGWKEYPLFKITETGYQIATLKVLPLDEATTEKLNAADANYELSIEVVTEGESYNNVKKLLNAEHDNCVEKFGYIKLILKDEAKNDTIDLSNSMININYVGSMGTLSNTPSYVYGVSSDRLTAGMFDTDQEPIYSDGMVNFTASMFGANEIAVVAQDDLERQFAAGTYTVTANLTVLGENNTVLPFPVQVYLGNPNFPPVTPLSYNAKMVVAEDGTKTITIENFSEIFQIYSMTSGDTIHIEDYETVPSKSETIGDKLGNMTVNYRHDKRINKLVLKIDNTSGLYEFGPCVQSPVILEEDTNMIMHLQVNFDECETGFDESKGDTDEKTFTDDETGVTVAVRTTEQAYADKLQGATLEVKENKNDNYSQMIQDMYYDGTVQKKIYDISLKDKDGKEIDLSNTDNTETKLTIKTDYEENRLWKLDGFDVTKMRVSSEKNLVTYTSLKTGLGTFAVVDNTSATQYASTRTNDGKAVGVYFSRQYTSGFGNMTEDTNLENGYGTVRISEKETSTGTAYQVAVVKPATGEQLNSIGAGTTKLGLYVPYSSAKEYYLVYTNGEEQTIQKLDASNHNEEYVFLTVLPEKEAADMNIINTGLYNAVTGNTSSWQCYVLATDRKLASTPSTVKDNYGANKKLTYSGLAQKCFTDGVNCQLTEGSLEYTHAGTYSITAVPEEGYCWADGTNTAKTFSTEIQKRKLAIRYKSEAVLVNGTPKYELEYGYTTSDGIYVGALKFVNNETPDTAKGFKAPTVTAHATDVAGDYVLTPEGGEADDYEIQLISGTLHVVDSQDKIVAIPKLYADTTYTCASESYSYKGGGRTYIVPKDAETIATVTGLEPVSEDAAYTLTGELTANELGSHSVKATLKEGYVWEDGTTYTKNFSYTLYQIIDKPEATEKAVYNGKQQSLFDEETLAEIKAGVKWGFPAYLDTSGKYKNDQYEETEVGDYEVKVMPKGNYCWDETGSKVSVTYHWSIVPAEEKEVASTDVITANLGVKGSDAAAAGLTILETLAGADGYAYLTNPNAPLAGSNEDNDPDWVQTPPTTPVNSNATLITYTDGTMALKVPVKNAVFTLQKLGASEQVLAEDIVITKRDGKYGAKTNRIDSITIPVTTKSGSVVFKNSEVYPTLLMTGYTVPLTLTWGTEVAQEKTSISNAEVSGIVDATYTGSAITQPNLKVTIGGGLVTLTEGTDYTVTYANNVNAGTATITITGIGNYKDSITRTFTIKVVQNNGNQNNGGQNNGTPQKGSQTINVKVGSKTYKYKNIQKKAASFTIGASAAGSVSYKVTSTPKKGSKYISVNSKGKVTVKKKAPAGTYQITVFASATADKNAASRIVTVNVAKSKQTLTAKVSKKTVKATALKKKAAKVTIKAKGKGKLTYKVAAIPAGANKYISVTKKGKVTLKKGAPKGTYKIQVTAGETSKYAKAVKTVSITVK